MLKLSSACRAACSRSARGQVWRRTLLTQSFIQGPTEPPLLDQTIAEHFSSIVSKYGDRLAVISREQNARFTYDALDRESNALAKGLDNIGVQKGDRVAVSLGNNIEFATAIYALFRLGAVLVPLNPALTTHQVTASLNHLTASHLIVGLEASLPNEDPRSNTPLLTSLSPNIYSGNPSTFESESVPSLRHITVVDNSAGAIDPANLRSANKYERLVEDGASGPPLSPRELHSDDIINIQFTSGIKGAPKAACLTHRSILNNGNCIGDRMLLTPEDIVCYPLPLYHHFGATLGCTATATHGACLVLPSEAFDPLATLHAVRENKCTALHGAPAEFLAALDLFGTRAVPRSSFEHLRVGAVAGGSVPRTLVEKAQGKLDSTSLAGCYGTETGLVSCMAGAEDPLEKRVESVGRVLPHVLAKVVDAADRSRVVPVGEKGELAVGGYAVMQGYWGDKARTDEVLVVDGATGVRWVYTGAEAVMDAEGYVSVTGRSEV